MINFYKIKLLLLLFLIGVETSFSQRNDISQIQNSAEAIPFVSKKAGIAFRIDDNPTKEFYSQMSQLFDHYNNNTFGRTYHFSFALNMARTEFDTTAYIDTVKAIQARGHEIMDHTPNHRTNYFTTKFPVSDYYIPNTTLLKSGIDRVISQGSITKICLEFNPIDTTGLTAIGTCSVSGNMLTGNFSSFNYDTDVYVYLLELDTLLYISAFNNNKSVAYVDDVWQEQISLGEISNVTFYKMTRGNRLSIDGLKVLAEETQKLALFYGLQKPKTWIQPGGRWPILSMSELKQALTPLGYTAGASFTDVVSPGVSEAFKVFNEYDPEDQKNFGIQWEDFNEDKTNQTIESIKTKISDGIAKHKVMIGHNHFYDLGKVVSGNSYVTPTVYFQRVAELLAWCNQNNIEVNTYNEWADILFDKTPDPYENIFPALNVNYDNFSNNLNPNGVPDGYVQRYANDHGKLVVDFTSPAPGNLCYAIGGYARVFLIQELAGIEKGENQFEIWTKGSTNDKIRVFFRFPNTNYPEKEYWIPSDTQTWTKRNLSSSSNGNTSLVIPDDVSRIEVEIKIYYFDSHGDSIKVTGMSLFKKKQSTAVNLKINLQGAYNNGTMSVDEDFEDIIPQNQPYNNTPWNYNGNEILTISHQNIIDWVLVELRSSADSNYYVYSRKAAILKSDGTIVNSDGTQFSMDVAAGNYYMVIYHRNHLPVMSSTAVQFN